MIRSDIQPKARLAARDRTSSGCSHGAGGGTIGSETEKKDIGASTDDAHGSFRVCARIGPDHRRRVRDDQIGAVRGRGEIVVAGLQLRHQQLREERLRAASRIHDPRGQCRIVGIEVGADGRECQALALDGFAEDTGHRQHRLMAPALQFQAQADVGIDVAERIQMS